jgi:diacylglycerol kinase family enzyme
MSAAGRGLLRCLINPEAGNAEAIGEVIAADPRVELAECVASSMQAAVRGELERHPERILIAGGDGTLAAAAAMLAGTGVTMGIVPGGTLNHFARRIGIPADPAEALRTAIEGATRRFDVGYVNERLFLNTSSIGSYVRFVHRRERLEPRFGYYLASAIALAHPLLDLRPHPVLIEHDREARAYTAPLVFVAVGEREFRFPALGDVVPSGRRGLHVIAIHARRRRSLLRLVLATATQGVWTASRNTELDSFIVEECTLRLPRARVMVATDGEIAPMAQPLHYRLAPSALAVAAPDGRERD